MPELLGFREVHTGAPGSPMLNATHMHTHKYLGICLLLPCGDSFECFHTSTQSSMPMMSARPRMH